MSSTTSDAMGSFYDDKRAATDLSKYREKGPIPSTRALIKALKASPCFSHKMSARHGTSRSFDAFNRRGLWSRPKPGLAAAPGP